MPLSPLGSRAQCQLKHPRTQPPASDPSPQLNREVEPKGEALETAGHVGLTEKGTHKPKCTVYLFVSGGWKESPYPGSLLD